MNRLAMIFPSLLLTHHFGSPHEVRCCGGNFAADPNYETECKLIAGKIVGRHRTGLLRNKDQQCALHC